MSDEWKKLPGRYFSSWTGIAFFGIFLVYFLSVFNSNNQAEYWSIFKNKIPFLFIPISLVCVQDIPKKHIRIIRYFFIVCCLYSSLWSYVQYIQHVTLYTQLYSEGEVMPTLIHHVSLSVLLCISVLFLLDLLLSYSARILQLLYILLMFWFVYFIHVLSVRTGIVLLYVSVILYALVYVLNEKKYFSASVILIFLICSSIFSYQKIPTIKSKIDYTVYGLSQIRNNNDTTNMVSDSRRVLSDKIGIEILKKNKLFGVGFGDLKQEMNFIYRTKYPSFDAAVYAHIHNQYIYSMCGVGLIAGGVFCIFLLLPFFQFVSEKNTVYSIVYLMLLLVMMWETFLENQLGTSIYLLVCCLGFVTKRRE